MKTAPSSRLVFLTAIAVATLCASSNMNATVLAHWNFNAFSPGDDNIDSITSSGSIVGGVTLEAPAVDDQPSATNEVPAFPPAVSDNSISGWFDSSDEDRLASDAVVSEFNFGENQAFTIEGWFNLTTMPDTGITQGIFSNRGSGDSGNAGFSILVSQNAQLIFSADDGPGGPVNASTGNDAITINTWYYFAAIRTGTGQMRIFLGETDPEEDPQLVAQTSDGAMPDALVSDNPTYMGTNANSPTGNLFGGYISEIRVSDDVVDVLGYEGLWSPVPEPSSLLLFGISGALFAIHRRRQLRRGFRG